MIDSLVSGKLARDPTVKTGPNGQVYVNFLVAVDNDNSISVSGIAFNEEADHIGRLRKGDLLSVAGYLEPSTWKDEATGEERQGLKIIVSALWSANDVKKCRPATEVNMAREVYQDAQLGRGENESMTVGIRSQHRAPLLP